MYGILTDHLIGEPGPQPLKLGVSEPASSKPPKSLRGWRRGHGLMIHAGGLMAEIRRLHQLRLVVFPCFSPLFIGFQHHPWWLGMGFQPSTVPNLHLPSLKLTCSHLKIDGWPMIPFLLKWSLF